MPGRERGMNKWEITEKIEMERLRTGAAALKKNPLTHTLDEWNKLKCHQTILTEGQNQTVHHQ